LDGEVIRSNQRIIETNEGVILEEFLVNSPFDGKPYTGVHKNAAIFFSSRKNWVGKHVIDLSCGDGITTYILQKLGATVSPYELRPEACKLEEKPKYANVQKALPIPDNSADVVIFQEVMEHLPNHVNPLQEIYRILKPGGELFITTPNMSSLQGRMAYLSFESENTKYTPWSWQDGVWGENEENEKYYGHLFLIGIQQMNTLAKIVGFKKTVVHRTELSKTSLFLFPILYPLIWLNTRRALFRDIRKRPNDVAYRAEKHEQYRLNLSLKTLLSKFMFVSFYK
jgi:SAM-dependent methyltransferase